MIRCPGPEMMLYIFDTRIRFIPEKILNSDASVRRVKKDEI